MGYPPFKRLFQVELKSTKPDVLDDEAENLMEQFVDIIMKNDLDILILGPARPPVYRVQKTEVRHLYIKGDSFKTIRKLCRAVDTSTFKSSVFITPLG